MASYVPLLPSKVRTADVTSELITVWEKYTAAHVVVNIASGSPKLVVKVRGKDVASGAAYDILTSSEITTGTTVLKIGPDFTAGTNVAKDYLPYNMFVEVAQSGGISTEYSVGISLI